MFENTPETRLQPHNNLAAVMVWCASQVNQRKKWIANSFVALKTTFGIFDRAPTQSGTVIGQYACSPRFIRWPLHTYDFANSILYHGYRVQYARAYVMAAIAAVACNRIRACGGIQFVKEMKAKSKYVFNRVHLQNQFIRMTSNVRLISLSPILSLIYACTPAHAQTSMFCGQRTSSRCQKEKKNKLRFASILKSLQRTSGPKWMANKCDEEHLMLSSRPWGVGCQWIHWMWPNKK